MNGHVRFKLIELASMTIIWVWVLVMGFQDVAYLPFCANFPPNSLEIVVGVKASGPPQALRLLLG